MIKKRIKSIILLLFILTVYASFIGLIFEESFAIDETNNGGFIQPQVYYSHWNETITVGMDGSLLITEEMTFSLDAGSYSYAYRNLRWRNFHNLNAWNIEEGINAPPIQYKEMEKNGDYIYFRWEWNSQQATQGEEYTFILTYNVSSALDLRGNRDRVYWNVIGGEFDYYILDISTRVIYPQEYNLSDIRSTTYYHGNNPGDDEGVASNIGGKTVVDFHQSSVAPHEAYTIDTDSPPAGIDMPFSWRVYINNNWIIMSSIYFIPIVLFFVILFFVKGKDPRVKNIPILNEVSIRKCFVCGYREKRKIKFCPQCSSGMESVKEIGPPDDLTPAEVGVLLDESFDNIDFVAEFFYLAEKGYLKLIQTPENDEIYFQRTEESTRYSGLSSFDKEILEFVERYSDDDLKLEKVTMIDNKEVKEVSIKVVSLSTIKSNAKSLWKYSRDVYDKITGGKTKYFESDPNEIIGKYSSLLLGVGIGIFIIASLIYQFVHISNYFAGIMGVITACFVSWFIVRKMSKLTKKGAQVKANWKSYLQIIRGEMLGFPDLYDQFNFSMEHFSYLLVVPHFNLPRHLRILSRKVQKNSPPADFHFITPYWYYYPKIMFSPNSDISHRTISGFDNIGRGFESVVEGISNLAESLPEAISNMSEGISSAISNMSDGFRSPSSSGGSGGFGGGSSGGGGGGGGGGIG